MWQIIKMMITAILVKNRMTVTVTVKMKDPAAAVKNPLAAAVVWIMWI